MNLENILKDRSQSHCELCPSGENLSVYSVPPLTVESADKSVLLCSTCRNLVENTSPPDTNHWRCLAQSMWSEHPAVQVMAWRLLKRLTDQAWAEDLLNQLYLDEETLKWAEAESKNENVETDDVVPTKDSNGNILKDGDSVTLIKDLDVKGANFTAKRGTLVKNISLTSNPAHIEGRVNGSQIVLLTCFLKKAGE